MMYALFDQVKRGTFTPGAKIAAVITGSDEVPEL
jgi:hypothetical protein